MIRDEFKKIQKEEKLTAKEIAGIRELGERAFYSSNLPKIISSITGLNTLAITCLIMGSIMTLIFVLYVVSTGKIGGSVGAWVSFISTIVTLSYALLWFFVFKKILVKKYEKYRLKIAELTKREMQKQQAIYTKLHKAGK